MVQQCDFLIIGSGPAGQKAAVQGAKAGRSVILVEREPEVGGMCVHKATIPSKALREAALRLQNARKTLWVSQQVELQPLMAKVGDVIAGHNQYIREQLERNDIRCLRGNARFVSSQRVEVTQPGGHIQHIQAGVVFIATGSIPRHPAQIDIDHEHVVDSDSILAMSYLPESMIVMGGGVIACEYASVFSALGCKVTMVDRFARPLGFIDDEMASRFVQAFELDDGQFLGKCQVESAAFDGVTDVEVKLEGGRVLKAEKMLVAQGRVSNLKGLNIAATDVTVSDMGLVNVDSDFLTTDSRIYAIGDVIGPPSLASAAMEQGRWAASHALDLPRAEAQVCIPLGIYAIPEVSSVGLTEREAVSQHGTPIVGYAEFNEVARGLISGHEQGMLKMIADPMGNKLLGVHIIGEGATELIHLGQMALINDMSIETFIDQIFNFPTLAEAYRVAALQIRGHLQAAREQGAHSAMPGA
jgi:NAD(P) transhydrogenase